MFDPEFKERLDTVNSALAWADVMPTIRESGTITCPFCERSGKGYLYPNFFKCFSSRCGVQGDKIAIYKKRNNLTFGEALRELEGKTNLDYQTQQTEFDKRNELMSKVLEAYVHQMQSHPEVTEWLINRGFQEEFIKQNDIGYTPHNSVLRGYDLRVNTLKRHGLCRKRGEFFRERIIFPVYNMNGYLVHLTGRSFPNVVEEYKYLDTPQVPIIGSCKDYLLFEKLLPLYKNKDNKTLFLVEGVPDSYILRQCGASVVGLMGLQKIIKQAKKFEDFDSVVAVFDNDRYELNHPNFPGQFKSWRIVLDQLIDLQLLLGKKVQIKTCMIQEGLKYKDSFVKDVNDLYLYLNKDSKETLRFLNESSVDLVEGYIDKIKGDTSYHKTALKLIAATNRGRNIMPQYIPKDMTSMEYALKVLID